MNKKNNELAKTHIVELSKKVKEYLEKERGRLALGRTLRSIRLGEEESQTSFAKKLGISTQYLCDLEHDRKIVSPKKAKDFAIILGSVDNSIPCRLRPAACPRDPAILYNERYYCSK